MHGDNIRRVHDLNTFDFQRNFNVQCLSISTADCELQSLGDKMRGETVVVNSLPLCNLDKVPQGYPLLAI